MKDDKDARLPSWRFDHELRATILAPIGAALVPMTIGVIYMIPHGGFDAEALEWPLLIAIITWVVAMLHLIVAIPLYLLLARFGWANWGTVALVGVLVSLPWWFLNRGGWEQILWAASVGLAGGLTFRAALTPVRVAP